MLCLKCQYKHTCRHKNSVPRKQLLCAISYLSKKLKHNCCISTSSMDSCNMRMLFSHLVSLQKTHERIQREKLKPFIVNELKHKLPKEIIINILQLATEWNTKTN